MTIHNREKEYTLLLDELLGEKQDRDDAVLKRTRSSSKMKARSLRAQLSPKQLLLANETARYVSVLCPRRSGKSYAILVSAMADCVEHAGFRVAIFCLSKPHAKGVYWEDMVRLNEKNSLGIKFHGTELVARFPNGSVLVLCGAESDAEISKVRGRKYHRVVIDESTVYNRRIYHDLIYLVVEPALTDLQGALWIAGTPKGEHSGPFYEATCTPPIELTLDDGSVVTSNWQVGTEKPAGTHQWRFHRWTAKDNLAVPHLWEEFLMKKKFRGWKDDNPLWRQEYLGEWVKLDDAGVFKIRRYQHVYNGIWPWMDGRISKCHFILGADFGFHDGTAIVIWCFVEDEPYIYEFISVKQHKLTEEQIAEMIKRTESLLPKPIQYRVGDTGGGGVLIMEGLRRTYGLHFDPAEKHDKVSHINYFNLALDSNLVRFQNGSALMEEMEAIQWDENTYGTSRQKEDKIYPNDLSDAALYAFRYAKARFVEAPRQEEQPRARGSEAEKVAYCAAAAAKRRMSYLNPYKRPAKGSQ